MENPKYSVSINYVPSRPLGQTLSVSSGVTYSVPTYSADYFNAQMPELQIFATGSSYQEALTNLLLIATASTTTNTGHNPHSNTRYW